ncbi:hypothetical protein VTO42DRAFT_8435 [Malbranchea cinnamomea]
MMELDQRQPASPTDGKEASPPDDSSSISITVHHHGSAHTISLPSESTLIDLSSELASLFSIPPENQKFLISPKPGLQKPPFAPTLLSSLPISSPRFKITLLGSTISEINTLNNSIASAQPLMRRNYPVKPAKPAPRSVAGTVSSQDTQYTFHRLLPLSYLPNPERSLEYLRRLRDDPGIRSAMRKHKFSVPLLTEMDPAQHTTMSTRTLGLNRNKGEVIELRLRTDAYDGYRDYRTIRKTLCHELAHCVYGEHDADFWRLTKQIEGEVERGDYWGKGRRLTDEEFYNPADWEEMKGVEEMDHGGWTGGEFVLGGSAERDAERGLSRREILARAAEARMTKGKRKERDNNNNSGRPGAS